MKTTLLIIKILLIILISSCEFNKTKEINHNDSIQTTTPIKLPENDKVDTSKKQLESDHETWNLNTIIGEGIIWRSGNQENNLWSEIVVTNIFGFKQKVDIGELVQVIPLRKQLSTIKLKVIDTKKRDDFDDGTDIWYEVELEKISENYKEYWSIKSLPGIREEYPSEVLIVYPPVENCTLLEGIQFESKDLPENISHDIIKGALDFDGDELPDAIVCAFCCSNRQAIVTCDNICGETYIKVNNKWTLVDSSSPL